jgi:hypothetical protein
MRNIVLFVEDYGHESFIKAVIQRFAEEYSVAVKIIPRSVRGGHGKAISELKSYLKKNLRTEQPELLIVAIDANCKGYQDCKKEIGEALGTFQNISLCAIPDPHIERWLLLDSAAFKKAVRGKGCSAPDQKCQRDRYKKLLMEAMIQSGVRPPLGGMEYAEDIVRAMDFERMEKSDPSLGYFLKSMRSKFNEWT